MVKAMIIYPPGRAFQRGEDRCQIDIEASIVNCARACNDLGYVAACLKQDGNSAVIRDYQSENLGLNDLIQDIKMYKPDILFLSITNGSIFDDLNVVKEVKKIQDNIVIIMKGA